MKEHRQYSTQNLNDLFNDPLLNCGYDGNRMPVREGGLSQYDRLTASFKQLALPPQYDRSEYNQKIE